MHVFLLQRTKVGQRLKERSRCCRPPATNQNWPSCSSSAPHSSPLHPALAHTWHCSQVIFDKEKITHLCPGSCGGVHRLLKNLSVVSRCRELARGSFCSCQSLSSKVIPRTIRLLENLPATILPKKKSTGQTTSKEEGRSPPSLPPRHPHVSPYWVPASPTSVRHRCWILFQKGDDYFCQQIPHPYRTTLILALSPSRGLFLFDNRRHNSFHQLLRHSCL